MSARLLNDKIRETAVSVKEDPVEYIKVVIIIIGLGTLKINEEGD
ncbi:hypothetical protein JOD44_000269 [Salimicrobium jeotgali]|nr:hypothetical protein [Salimicrobium jeotgali]